MTQNLRECKLGASGCCPVRRERDLMHAIAAFQGVALFEVKATFFTEPSVPGCLNASLGLDCAIGVISSYCLGETLG